MLSVGRIMEGTFGLIRERFMAVLIWIAIYLAANVAMMLAMGPMFATALDPTASANPAELLATIGPVYLLGFVVSLVGIVLYTGAMRAVLRPDAGGIGFLRVGIDELRVLGLLLLFAIAALIGLVGSMMLIMVVGAGISMGGDSPVIGGLLMLLFMLALFPLLIFLTVRMSLAFPLTLHRRKLVLGEAWRLSRGRFWTLFGAALVVSVIGMVMSLMVSTLTMGSFFLDVMQAAGDPEAARRAVEAQSSGFGQMGPMVIVYAVGNAITGGLWIALSGGSIATAAKLLVADTDDDAEAVFG